MLHKMSVTVLERPIYGMWQVDSMLGLHGGTARRWIDGYERRGHLYPPVIREERTGVEVVTWGEFVEARLLANYRSKGVPLVKMRPVVERLRQELRTPYPLAAARLYADGGELVQQVQEEVRLERGLHLVVVVRTGQIAASTTDFAPPVKDFLEHVGFDDGGEYAAKIFPLGRDTAVALDPDYAFGAPAVGSVRTDVLAEEFRAGDSIESIADGYGLSREQVSDALRFELQQNRAA